MQYKDIEEKIRAVLGIEQDDKGLVEFVFDSAKETVLNYCNLEEIPDGLKNTVLRMAVDIYRNEQPGSEEISGDMAAINLGDTSVSFRNMSEEFQEGLLKDYKMQLNRYRRLKR